MAQKGAFGCFTGYCLTPAADELQHHLAPMRPGAVLGEIKSLPGAKRELSVGHRHLQRDTVDHGLHVRRHVIGSFGIVNPTRVRRRNAIERAASGDRRRHELAATPAGRALFKRALPLWVAAEQEVRAAMGAKLTADLRGALDRSMEKLAAL